MAELKCKCGSDKFIAIEKVEIVDIIDKEGNVIDSSYSQWRDSWSMDNYEEITCANCGQIIRKKGQ